MINLNKHFLQIKKGGILVVIKKLRSLIYLILQIPIYLISIPIIIVIRLIRPWCLIRWLQLESGRIGHFAMNTELYCCKRDAGINTPSQRYIDVFYLKKYICNRQLEKMWRRKLVILPAWLLFPLNKINSFLNIFIAGGEHHEIEKKGYSSLETDQQDRDIYNLVDRFPPHLSFTEEEEAKGKKILNKFGVPSDVKFVCLIVRDSAYLSRYEELTLRDWQYQSYRDGDIDNYVLAAEELANRGYYVFRMGVKVLKPLKSSNSKVIDYANSAMRSDFMDIYLGAKCSFCISAEAGFEKIPALFRRPLVGLQMPLAFMFTGSEKDLLITKHHTYKKSKKKMTISEIFSSDVALSEHTNEFKERGVELEENSPEEIRDLIIEMDERLNETWKETEEDLLLQKKFWSIYEESIKKLNLKLSMHGKIKSKFGAKFLRDNQNWIR